MSEKKILFHHIFLHDNISEWIYLIFDQFNSLIQNNLIEELDEIYVCTVGNEYNFSLLEDLLKVFSHFYRKKIHINYVQKKISDDEMIPNLDKSKIPAITEEFTLKFIWDYSRSLSENEKILYLHTKGSTFIKKFLEKREYTNECFRFFCLNNWRKFMEWGVIEKYKECCLALDEYDTAGVNWVSWPLSHYSGNFWWANSNHLKKLMDPSKNLEWWKEFKMNNHCDFLPDRIKDEMWLGSTNPKMFSFYNHHSPPPISNLGEILIKRDEYCK